MPVAQAPGYALRVDPDAVDTRRFERPAVQGREAIDAGEAEGAAERLEEALGLRRGPALAEFAFCEFAVAEGARLQGLRLPSPVRHGAVQNPGGRPR